MIPRMGNGFKPVGAALPPRRDGLARVNAADGAPPTLPGGADSIIVPEARDRMLELIEREQLPTDVRSTLAGALTGDLRRQQLLFQAMIDTWPRLQKALAEVKRAARKAPWQVRAWAPRGEKPQAAAEILAREVETTVWGMRPDPIRGEKGLEGTIEELVMGYYLGHQVLEVHWERGDGWQPRATKVVPPRFYGYPYDEKGEDRLMLDRTGGMSGWNALEDFPPHRFLVAVNGGHPGHASIAAPLRALTGFWLAAVYGLKWLLQFAQVCGVPIRWAEYGSEPDRKKVAEMLQNIGTAGWGAFPAGTKLNFVETSKQAQNIPQKVLADMADEQCVLFVLGQTLTSSAGDRGSQALGTVHEGVRQDVIAGVCDFVGEVLSYQFVPSIIAVNHGKERKDIPGIWVEWPETKDEEGLAERDEKLGLTTGRVPVARAWFYERHGIPLPAEGEELFLPAGQDSEALNPKHEARKEEEEASGQQSAGKEGEGDEEKEEELKAGGKKPVAAADAGGAVAPVSVEQLSGAVLEGLTGVSAEWLRPVRPFFERLAALAMSKHVTDADFLAALEQAQAQLPELFDLLDAGALQTAFERAIGSAMLAGSFDKAAGSKP
jgi:phage gp29-like protein